MENKSILLDNNSVPADVKFYFQVIEQNKDHQIVKNFFREIKHLSLPLQKGKFLDFYVIEMRIENKSFLVWQDAEERWGIGDPIFLPNDDSDLADSDFAFSIDYFQNGLAYESFTQVLEFINHLLDLAEQADPDRKIIRFSRN